MQLTLCHFLSRQLLLNKALSVQQSTVGKARVSCCVVEGLVARRVITPAHVDCTTPP